MGKKDEISEKEFVEKATSDSDYDQVQEKEMLRMLYGGLSNLNYQGTTSNVLLQESFVLGREADSKLAQ